MSFSTGEIISFLVALLAGGFVVWGEVIKRRTPSVEKEAEQEDQWRKELWDINRTLSADLDAARTQLKETRRLQEQTEEQNGLLKNQLAQLQHEKAAWVLERQEMHDKISVLEKDVYRLTTEVIRLQRQHDQTNGSLR
jgi:hypothetical protein